MAAQSQIPVANHSVDEHDLFQRAKAGDKNAAQQLFDLHEPEYRTIIRKHLAGRVRPLEDSFDLLQETRLALVEKPLPANIDSPRELLAYLSTIARNKALQANREHLECQKRTRRREIPLDRLENDQEPCKELDLHEEVETKDRFIQRCLQKRQEADLCLLKMFRSGLSAEQIAEKIRFSAGFVEKCLERARKLEAELRHSANVPNERPAS
jgi:RNA polymerase sigma factor (sigma-70 family)